SQSQTSIVAAKTIELEARPINPRAVQADLPTSLTGTWSMKYESDDGPNDGPGEYFDLKQNNQTVEFKPNAARPHSTAGEGHITPARLSVVLRAPSGNAGGDYVYKIEGDYAPAAQKMRLAGTSTWPEHAFNAGSDEKPSIAEPQTMKLSTLWTRESTET